jgi:hypothetical protein
MTGISKASPKITPIQFFYFDDYLEPASSAGTFPMAVFNNDKYEKDLNNTAWFPYYSSYQLKNTHLEYSLEAHELGHILLQQGHLTTDVWNIMADNSALRRNIMSPTQCKKIQLPRQYPKQTTCSNMADNIASAFKLQFSTYSLDSYMSLECARNAENLWKRLKDLELIDHANIQILYIIHNNPQRSLKPLQARESSLSWSYHVVLLYDGLVLDQDYTSHAQILGLKEYLKNMWGEASKDFLFQLRPPDRLAGYTNKEIKTAFQEAKFPVMDLSMLLKYEAGNCSR